jgi:hypothetical protein
MTPEELALKVYPVKYQRDVNRQPPDLNLPLRTAFLEGWKAHAEQDQKRLGQ